MLHTKCRGNQSNDFEKIFKGFWHGGHLGHVTSIMSLNFIFLVRKSLITKFCTKWFTGV